MTFTYSGTINTDLARVRLRIRDVTQNQGPLPGDANLTDEEINGLLADEGNWQRAVAGAFETLAAAWRRYPSFATEGLRLDRTAIADGYAAQAKEWRAKAGATTVTGGGRAGSRAPTRVDGYSQDTASDAT